jgi:excisionase family DNA binding protein
MTKNNNRQQQPLPRQEATEQAVSLHTPISVSLSDAASMIGVSKTRYYQLIEKEGAPAFHIGKRHLVSVDELKQWIADQHNNSDVQTAMQNGGVA